MWLEVLRLCFGILLMAVHRQVADYVMYYERLLHGMLASRGVNLPEPFEQRTAHTVYFSLGILVCLVSLLRIRAGLAS